VPHGTETFAFNSPAFGTTFPRIRASISRAWPLLNSFFCFIPASQQIAGCFNARNMQHIPGDGIE
jgi:hypothetical protein